MAIILPLDILEELLDTLTSFGWMAVVLIIAIIIAALVLIQLLFPFLAVLFGLFLIQIGQVLLGTLILVLGVVMFIGMAFKYASEIHFPHIPHRMSRPRTPPAYSGSLPPIMPTTARASCPNCGKVNRPQAFFCTHCRTRLP